MKQTKKISLVLVILFSILRNVELEEFDQNSVFEESNENDAYSYHDNFNLDEKDPNPTNKTETLEVEVTASTVGEPTPKQTFTEEIGIKDRSEERILFSKPVPGSFCIDNSMCKTSSTLMQCRHLKCHCLWNYPHQLGILNMAWCGECQQCVSIQGSACDKNANGLGTIRCSEGLICRQTDGRPEGQGTCSGSCLTISFVLLTILFYLHI